MKVNETPSNTPIGKSQDLGIETPGTNGSGLKNHRIDPSIYASELDVPNRVEDPMMLSGGARLAAIAKGMEDIDTSPEMTRFRQWATQGMKPGTVVNVYPGAWGHSTDGLQLIYITRQGKLTHGDVSFMSLLGFTAPKPATVANLEKRLMRKELTFTQFREDIRDVLEALMQRYPDGAEAVSIQDRDLVLRPTSSAFGYLLIGGSDGYNPYTPV